MRRKSRCTTIELLVLAGVTAACLRGRTTSAQPAPAPETPQAALQSVYYYAFHSTHPTTPATLHPPPLSAAVSALKNDQSPDGPARRHLAIAKLVGGSTLHKNPGGAVQLQPPEFGTAVQELAGGDTSKILGRLATLPPGASRQQKEKATFGAIGGGAVTTLRAATSCPATVNCPDPTLDGQTVHINFTLQVGLPFKQVIRAMYPRFWAKCNSTFFERAYAALQKPDKTFLQDPVTGDVKEDPKQPLPTTPGKKQEWVLFEHFRIEATQVSFKNLLDITEDFTDPGTYVLTYHLHQSINHSIGGTPPEPGGITVDEGFLKVIAVDENSTLFFADKKIQFDEPALNDIALNVIHGICNETAGQGAGAGAGVCCNPTQ